MEINLSSNNKKSKKEISTFDKNMYKKREHKTFFHFIFPYLQISTSFDYDRRTLDESQTREILLEIRVTLGLNFALIRLFSNLEDAIDDFHSRNNFGKRSEAHGIETAVIAKVDEHLTGARICAGSREGDKSTKIGLFGGIISELLLAPFGGDGGISADAELGHEPFNDAEETNAGEEVGLDEFLETGGAQWSPVVMNLHDKRTFVFGARVAVHLSDVELDAPNARIFTSKNERRRNGDEDEHEENREAKHSFMTKRKIIILLFS